MSKRSCEAAISESRPWPPPEAAYSMKINPQQVAAFNEEIRRRGIQNAHYETSGELRCYSNKSRNGVLRMLGAQDNDAGYGQVADS